MIASIRAGVVLITFFITSSLVTRVGKVRMGKGEGGIHSYKWVKRQRRESWRNITWREGNERGYKC